MNEFAEKDTEKLKKAIAESEKKFGPAPIKVEKILDNIDCLLTDKAKEMFKKPKVTSLRGIIGENDEWIVRYFGTTSHRESVGALRIANIANEIAEKYSVVGVLSPPIQINLISCVLKYPYQTATVFYVAIPRNKEINHEYYINGSCDVPSFKEDTNEELILASKANLDILNKETEPELPNIAHYRFRITNALLSSLDTDIEILLNNEINRLLSILPKDTTHISTTLLPITGLYHDYHIRFQNKLFLKDSEIKDTLSYTRGVSCIDGEFISYNYNNALNFEDFIKTEYKGEEKSIGALSKELAKELDGK